MHEFTVTSWIVEALFDLVKKEGADRVFEVHLRIGKLRALSLDQVRFCYDVLAKGTALEGSSLIIEESAGRVRCVNCSYHAEFNPEGDTYHFGLPPLSCPQCGSSVSVEGGDECVITKIRMQVPSALESATPP
jgi:hydrogenase nickel incorporation protein HypA/HybF